MDFQTLNLLFRCSKEFSHEKISVKGLNDTECMICSYVFSHPDCSQDEVAASMKADKTTIAKALQALEKKNCIERRQDESDRRKKLLRVTGTGEEKMSGLMNMHDEWLKAVLCCLSEDEQTQFESYCERLLAAAEALIEKQSGK